MRSHRMTSAAYNGCEGNRRGLTPGRARKEEPRGASLILASGQMFLCHSDPNPETLAISAAGYSAALRLEGYHLDRIGIGCAANTKRLTLIGFDLGPVCRRNFDCLPLRRLDKAIVIGGGVDNGHGACVFDRNKVADEMPRAHDVAERLDRFVRRYGSDIAGMGIILRRGGYRKEGCGGSNKSKTPGK